MRKGWTGIFIMAVCLGVFAADKAPVPCSSLLGLGEERLAQLIENAKKDQMRERESTVITAEDDGVKMVMTRKFPRFDSEIIEEWYYRPDGNERYNVTIITRILVPIEGKQSEIRTARMRKADRVPALMTQPLPQPQAANEIGPESFEIENTFGREQRVALIINHQLTEASLKKARAQIKKANPNMTWDDDAEFLALHMAIAESPISQQVLNHSDLPYDHSRRIEHLWSTEAPGDTTSTKLQARYVEYIGALALMRSSGFRERADQLAKELQDRYFSSH